MKKVAIFGLGISGLSTINFLINNNRYVIAIDDKKESLEALKAKYQSRPELLDKIDFCFDKKAIKWSEVEFLILSPGVPLTHPAPHEIVVLARENDCPIIGDTELFYLNNKDKNFIGITGTNGKSTTTALTGHIFKECKISSQIGGNIGVPCFDLPQSSNYIFEMSSFQLDLTAKSHFHIACITNITQDHLDRHGDMDGYIAAKKRIFFNQTSNDFALLNIDDEICLRIYQDLKANKDFKPKIIAISTKTNQQDAICVTENAIINNISGTKIAIEDFPNLKGNHNKQNLAFAYACAFLSDIKDDQIINAVKSFKPLKHRLEFVRKIGNVSFINDSKATNAISALCALEAYKDIFWIAGGKGKNDDLSVIKPYLKNIKKAFLIGQDEEKFTSFLESESVECYRCGNLENAINESFDLAKKQDSPINIILSPACASYDQWKNFEERGEYFCKAVSSLRI